MGKHFESVLSKIRTLGQFCISTIDSTVNLSPQLILFQHESPNSVPKKHSICRSLLGAKFRVPRFPALNWAINRRKRPDTSFVRVKWLFSKGFCHHGNLFHTQWNRQSENLTYRTSQSYKHAPKERYRTVQNAMRLRIWVQNIQISKRPIRKLTVPAYRVSTRQNAKKKMGEKM